jgi:single-stranded DNA-binding protein
MYQRIDLIGNLVADAEVRTGKDGNEFISFRVAANEYHGEEKRATFYEVNCRKTDVIKLLKSGTQVFVTGRISLSAVCKDGKAYLNAYVSATDVKVWPPRD